MRSRHDQGVEAPKGQKNHNLQPSLLKNPTGMATGEPSSAAGSQARECVYVREIKRERNVQRESRGDSTSLVDTRAKDEFSLF